MSLYTLRHHLKKNWCKPVISAHFSWKKQQEAITRTSNYCYGSNLASVMTDDNMASPTTREATQSKQISANTTSIMKSNSIERTKISPALLIYSSHPGLAAYYFK